MTAAVEGDGASSASTFVDGIVLAGGRSRRFGRDKLTERLPDGESLLGHAIEPFAATCRVVAVVVAPDAEPGPTIGHDLPPNVRIVHDTEPYGGPLVGVLAGLRVVEADVVLLGGGDQPTMLAPVLRLLADRLDAEPSAEGLVLEVVTDLPPLPCAVRRGAALEAATDALATGDRRLRGLFERLRIDTIEEATWRSLDPEGKSVFDVDRPEDLAQ